MNIAALYTCHNRKEKTISSINHLYRSLTHYNSIHTEKINIKLYLTDDGSTDGSANTILEEFPSNDVRILQGSGNLYWAGGMRFAWNEALKEHDNIDFYLLINDDTNLSLFALDILLSTHDYCIEQHNRPGIYSGCTLSKDGCKTTYGGDIIINRFMGKHHRVSPTGKPLLVDVCNANILLVPKGVVNIIGILYDGYRHGFADFDYSLNARKKNIPVYITSDYCGYCDNDHQNRDRKKKEIMEMDLQQRKNYFSCPLHSNEDQLLYIRRNFIYKYPFTWIMRKLHLYFPCIYYLIKKY